MVPPANGDQLRRYRILLRVVASILVVVVGLALAAGGIYLVRLGGTWGYVVLGALLTLSGGLLLTRSGAELAAYAVALLFTLGWGVWEVGLDWWALAPRGGPLVALGLMLLLPPVVRPLRRGRPVLAGFGARVMSLAAAVAATAMVAAASIVARPHDIDGAFPPACMAAVPAPAGEAAADLGEWPAYGCTSAGLRYSPLDQITPGSLDKLDVA